MNSVCLMSRVCLIDFCLFNIPATRIGIYSTQLHCCIHDVLFCFCCGTAVTRPSGRVRRAGRRGIPSRVLRVGLTIIAGRSLSVAWSGMRGDMFLKQIHVYQPVHVPGVTNTVVRYGIEYAKY